MKRRNLSAAIFVAGTMVVAGCNGLENISRLVLSQTGPSPTPLKIGTDWIPSTPEPAVQKFFPAPAPNYGGAPASSPTATPKSTPTQTPTATPAPTPTPKPDDYTPEIINLSGKKDQFTFRRDYPIAQRAYVYFAKTGSAEEFTVFWGDGKSTSPVYGDRDTFVEGYIAERHYYGSAYHDNRKICIEAAGPKLIRKVCCTIKRDPRFPDSVTYVETDFTVEITPIATQ